MRLYVYVLFVYVRLVAGSKTETTLTRGNKDAGRPVCLTEPEGNATQSRTTWLYSVRANVLTRQQVHVSGVGPIDLIRKTPRTSFTSPVEGDKESLPSAPLLLCEDRTSWRNAAGCRSCGS